jgi:hypothetical protein
MREAERRGVRLALVLALLAGAPGAANAAGALAIGTCGAYGQAFDFQTTAAAQKSAMEQCREPGCRIVATLYKACAALAVDAANPCGAHGSGKAPQLGAAQNDALRACYRDGGKDCVIRTFVCDGKG